ncbi:MAG: alpha/beta fold hydrolase [Leptospiraceae bacterium]|nr:alpha/beta fold hydrolase [Leptospiraceae bacterium]
MDGNTEVTNLHPPKFLNNNHVQTIFTTIFPPKNNLKTKYESDVIILKTKDESGDFLWLDHNPPLSKTDKKAVSYNGYYMVLFHGMEGTSDSHYIVSLAEAALLNGYGVIRVNQRGCGKGEGLSKKGYNAGKTDDVALIENHVYRHYSKKIILCGFSLSANIILKYFGEKRTIRSKFFSAVSPPLDLKRACEYIDSPAGLFYRRVFLDSFKDKFKRGVLMASKEIKQNAYNAKTMFDFDDLVTAPLFDYKGALDYYKHNSSIHFIHKIKTKGIVIHAMDDPLIPPDTFRSIHWKKIPSLTPILTETGGHVGFITRKTEEIPDGKWLNFILLQFFRKLI